MEHHIWSSFAAADAVTKRGKDLFRTDFYSFELKHEEDRRSPTLMGAAYSSDIIGDGHTPSIWDDPPYVSLVSHSSVGYA